MKVRDLASHLLFLIENGEEDKKVRVSVSYDNCEHMKDLSNIYEYEAWITLCGGCMNE